MLGFHLRRTSQLTVTVTYISRASRARSVVAMNLDVAMTTRHWDAQMMKTAYPSYPTRSAPRPDVSDIPKVMNRRRDYTD